MKGAKLCLLALSPLLLGCGERWVYEKSPGEPTGLYHLASRQRLHGRAFITRYALGRDLKAFPPPTFSEMREDGQIDVSCWRFQIDNREWRSASKWSIENVVDGLVLLQRWWFNTPPPGKVVRSDQLSWIAATSSFLIRVHGENLSVSRIKRKGDMLVATNSLGDEFRIPVGKARYLPGKESWIYGFDGSGSAYFLTDELVMGFVLGEMVQLNTLNYFETIPLDHITRLEFDREFLFLNHFLLAPYLLVRRVLWEDKVEDRCSLFP